MLLNDMQQIRKAADVNRTLEEKQVTKILTFFFGEVPDHHLL